MTGRTHDLAAITVLGVVFVLGPTRDIGLSTAIVAVLANLMGGITPDIDQPTAPLWRNLPIGKYFGKMFGLLNGGHRFLTHSLLGLYLFGVAAHWLLAFVHPIAGSIDLNLVWRAFMLGMASHLVMDMFTKEGVPLLLPLPFKLGIPPIKGLRITTGKWRETFVVFPLLLLCNAVFYVTHYRQVLDILHHHII